MLRYKVFLTETAVVTGGKPVQLVEDGPIIGPGSVVSGSGRLLAETDDLENAKAIATSSVLRYGSGALVSDEYQKEIVQWWDAEGDPQLDDDDYKVRPDAPDPNDPEVPDDDYV